MGLPLVFKDPSSTTLPEPLSETFISNNVLKGLFKDHLIADHVLAVRAPHGSRGTDGNDGLHVVVVYRLDF